MFCPKCGNKLTDDTKFCVFCGTAVIPNASQAVEAAPTPNAGTASASQPDDVKASNSETNAQSSGVEGAEAANSTLVSPPTNPQPQAATESAEEQQMAEEIQKKAEKIDGKIDKGASCIIMVLAVIGVLVIVIPVAIGLIRFGINYIKHGKLDIDEVKEAYLEDHEEKTIGDAFENYAYFEDFSWGEGTFRYNGETVDGVAFCATITMYDEYNEKNVTEDIEIHLIRDDDVTGDFGIELLGVIATGVGDEDGIIDCIYQNEMVSYNELGIVSAGTTAQTTAAKEKTTTTKTTETTKAAKQKSTKPAATKSSASIDYYTAYSEVLRSIDNSALLYRTYNVFDLDGDGTQELIVMYGTCEADTVYEVWGVSDDGTAVCYGSVPGTHSVLIRTYDGESLYIDMASQGYQAVDKLCLSDGSVYTETISELKQVSNDDYVTNGESYLVSDIADFSELEALSSTNGSKTASSKSELPYVEGEVKTYSLSGHDGAKIHLFLSGDFSYVTVQIQNPEYTGEVETYAKEDFDEYIEIPFNAFAQLKSVVYVTPFRDTGVSGETIVCDIPTDPSGTLQTDGMFNSIESRSGQINCHGDTVASFSTSYVVDGGSSSIVRESLGDGWHVTAKNQCYNYGITWYELWDTDDGDYYGWVDENYIDFY